MGERRKYKKHRRKHHRSRRRSASIPRGFLDYVVLQTLNTNSMSGTELMDEIEEKTNWRPGPGSIYPLLRKLNEQGSIEEVPSEEPGLKRFIIKENGKLLLEEQKRRNEFREKFHSFRRLWLRIYKEMDEELYMENLRLFESVEKISILVKDDPIVSEKIRKIMNKAALDIEEIGNQLLEDVRQ